MGTVLLSCCIVCCCCCCCCCCWEKSDIQQNCQWTNHDYTSCVCVCAQRVQMHTHLLQQALWPLLKYRLLTCLVWWAIGVWWNMFFLSHVLSRTQSPLVCLSLFLSFFFDRIRDSTIHEMMNKILKISMRDSLIYNRISRSICVFDVWK
jgi:hypothetical protein